MSVGNGGERRKLTVDLSFIEMEDNIVQKRFKSGPEEENNKRRMKKDEEEKIQHREHPT